MILGVFGGYDKNLASRLGAKFSGFPSDLCQGASDNIKSLTLLCIAIP
jgi:hypothetical protein